MPVKSLRGPYPKTNQIGTKAGLGISLMEL